MRARIGLACLLVVSVTACGLATSGNLQAVIDPDSSTVGFDNFSNGFDKSFGIFICSQDGPVELASVEAVSVEGDIQFLGGVVYTSSDRFIGAAHGFPPDGIDESLVEPVEGAVVNTDCVNPKGDKRVQLVVGAERTDAGGGQIVDLVVKTDGEDLEIPLTILLCGDLLEHCDDLAKTSSGG